MYNLLDSPISPMKTPPVLIKTNIGVSVSSHRSIPRSAALFIEKQPGTSTTVFAPKKCSSTRWVIKFSSFLLHSCMNHTDFLTMLESFPVILQKERKKNFKVISLSKEITPLPHFPSHFFFMEQLHARGTLSDDKS